MKKKILMIAVAVCLIVLSIAGTSLAYFTDTDAKETEFTAGNVDIQLDFTVVKNENNIYPGMEYPSGAQITNLGSENAYVGAIISFRGASINNLLTDSSAVGNINNLLKDFVTDGTDYAITYKKLDNGYDVYVVKNAAIRTSEAVTLFTAVSIPSTWDNAEMGALNGASVTVTAYATQTVFADANVTAAQALAKAFDVWNLSGGNQ